MENPWVKPQDSRDERQLSLLAPLIFHGFNRKVVKPETKGRLPSGKKPLLFLSPLTFLPCFKTQFPEPFPNQPSQKRMDIITVFALLEVRGLQYYYSHWGTVSWPRGT